jgi:hypothetical protein
MFSNEKKKVSDISQLLSTNVRVIYLPFATTDLPNAQELLSLIFQMYRDLSFFGTILQDLHFIWMGRLIFRGDIVFLTTTATFEIDFNAQYLLPLKTS